MKDSKIEWTHHTFNPWWGCVKVSPGCQHCYAETFSKRTGNDVWGVDKPRRFFGDKHWAEPLKWDAEAFESGERRRVFCASMADVFEDRRDLDDQRAKLFTLILKTPNLDWLLLTKRPENIKRLMHPSALWGIENVWLGTTCENQEQANRRIPHLLSVPAAVRFLSCEPLLGPVNLKDISIPDGGRWDVLNGIDAAMQCDLVGKIDWVIVGGESGPGARPMNPDWAQSLRDQCQLAGVPFLFKQWGDFAISDVPAPGDVYFDSDDWRQRVHMRRVGKKVAGRLLDGREWNECPAPEKAVQP